MILRIVDQVLSYVAEFFFNVFWGCGEELWLDIFMATLFLCLVQVFAIAS